MLNWGNLARRLGMLALLGASACVRLGPLTIETSTKLCNERGAVYCRLLAEQYLRATWNAMSDTWGLSIDKKMARDTYLKACDLDDKPSCARLLEYRLLEDPATIARVEGKLAGMSLRSDEAIEAELETDAQKAEEFDAKVAESTPGAAEYLGAASQVLGKQASVTTNAKTAKALEDASKLSGKAADVAKVVADAEAASPRPPRPPGEGHRLLLARRGAGPVSSLGTASAQDSNMSLLGLGPGRIAQRPPPPPPEPEPAAMVAVVATGGPAGESELARKALVASVGDKTAAFLRKQCNAKPAECFSLANGYANGSFELPKDGDTGVALFQRACDGGELNGCVMVLNIVWSGMNGVKVDKPRGKTLARSACERGSSSACFTFVSVMSPAPDQKVFAQQQLAKQCDAGDPNGCHYLVSGDFKSPRGKHCLEQLASMCAQKNPAACSYLDSYRKAGHVP